MKKQKVSLVIILCVMLIFLLDVQFLTVEVQGAVSMSEAYENINEADNETKQHTVFARFKVAVVRIIRILKTQPEPPQEDFILNISVEESTVQRGEGFRVNVELINNSGEDVNILHSFLFWPHIPDWDLLINDFGGVAIDPPYPRTRLFEAGSVLRNIGLMGDDSAEPWLVGTALEPGTHELRFRAGFQLLNGEPRGLSIWSNTVVLTVQ